MECRISRLLLDRLGAELARCRHAEICGLLLGTDGSIADALAAENIAVDRGTGFAIDPALLLRTSRDARKRGLRIIGHYHSHPTGNNAPSIADAEQAQEQGLYWLIVSAEGARLWISKARGSVMGAFEPVLLRIETTALQPEGAHANRGRGENSAITGAVTG